MTTMADKRHEHALTLWDVEARAHEADLAEVRRALARWLLAMDEGMEFQAVDFTRHLRGLRIVSAAFDARACGGLWSRLRKDGAVVVVGYRANGGDREVGHHSCARPQYRLVDRGAVSATGWAEWDSWEFGKGK